MPFREISGHTHLLGLLGAAARRGSLPPSLILSGPEGVGKRTAAVALAQALNCVGAAAGGPPGPDACGVCSACSRIARGVHPDVLTVAPGETGAIRVDQVRDVIERTAYRPFEGRRRVTIIDAADRMVDEAQNALLKTLEEPPASSSFILVTSRPDLLLPTVRSRCQRLRFGRLAPGETAAVLMRVHGWAPADAHAAASVSDGSVGAALDGGSDEFAKARDAALRLLQAAAASRDVRRRLDAAKSLTVAARRGSDRDELARRLRALASMIRDLGAVGARADPKLLANADLVPLFDRLAAAFGGDRALRAFDAIDRALAALDRNASPKIVADWVALQV
ncbi:MAG TPA: DNA polymerase III subunit delta' [Vicinamibacterales bacterium]|nr:DNA polymerase III subunit delta' [Vicinamibacterales bacterium]